MPRTFLLQLVVSLSLAGGMLPISSPAGPSRSAPRYRVEDLGTLAGCDTTYAQSVNDAGWVVGYAYKHVPPGHGNSLLSRPFLWRDGVMTELRQLGGMYGQAMAINSRGDVGGYAETKDSRGLPVIWQRPGGHVPVPLSDQPGRVTSLLDDGTAAGSMDLGDRRWAALRWGGRWQALGRASDLEGGSSGVDRTGRVAGFFIPNGGNPQSPVSPGSRRAALWQDGEQVSLPDLGGERSACTALSAKGTAVGWSDSPAGRRACRWQGGRVQALPAPKGVETQAHGINETGMVVGEASKATGDRLDWYACVWRDGKHADLNRLIPAGSGWRLMVASAISNRGLIVGYGHNKRYPNHRRAFLLKPQ